MKQAMRKNPNAYNTLNHAHNSTMLIKKKQTASPYISKQSMGIIYSLKSLL